MNSKNKFIDEILETFNIERSKYEMTVLTDMLGVNFKSNKNRICKKHCI